MDDYLDIPAGCRRRNVHCYADALAELSTAGIRLVASHQVTAGYAFLQSRPEDGLFIGGLSGTLQVQVGGRQFGLEPDRLCWCPWQQRREVRVVGGDWEGLLVFVNPQGCAAAAGPAQWLIPTPYLHSLRAAIEGLISEVETTGDRACLPGFSAAVIAWMQRAIHTRAIGGRLQALDVLARRIRSSPKDDWDLERMASELGVSVATARRWITAETGRNPRSWLAHLRMQQACAMLRTSADPLKIIARHVGYGTAFSFSHAFKRHLGCTPQDYRRRNEAMP